MVSRKLPIIFERVIGENNKAGRGVLISRLGSVYEGWFFNDKFNFRGRIIWQDGSMYEGEWKDDLQHGHGIYTLLNGNKWEGEFEKGSAVGIGKFTSAKTGITDERKFDQNCAIF